MRYVTAALFLSVVTLQALVTPLNNQDIERALALARRPPSERGRFHSPYIFSFNGPVIDGYFRLERIEITTEFRRVVLRGEVWENAKMIIGVMDVQKVLPTWADRVTVAASLNILPTTHYIKIGGPIVEIALDGGPTPLSVRRSAISPSEGTMTGSLTEADFSARALGQRTYNVQVLTSGQPIGEARVDFRMLQ